MAGKKGAPSGAAKANTKKKPAPARKAADIQQEDHKQVTSHNDCKSQQKVLDVFRHAFSETLSSPDFTTTLQSVKQALYDRDFARAFGDPEHLAVYAARWSPTRALCYASVLSGIREHLEPLLYTTQTIHDNKTIDNTETDTTVDPQPSQQFKILSIGGGAAELVALGAFLHQHPLSGTITLLDSGPWSPVITQLTTALTTPPPLSKYASASAKLANTALVSPADRLTATFHQRDALALSADELASLLDTTTTTTAAITTAAPGTGTGTPLLVTLLFTLNELFTASGVGKTTAFLLSLTAALPFGSLLLVVDSPGSYSETRVGGTRDGKDGEEAKEAKRYPMAWLLDRVLLGTRREPVGGRRWAKVQADESVWFRLGQAGGKQLEYPIALEDMRYQMHLYRVGDASLEEEVDD